MRRPVRGFTLIELLIVIVIIGILAAIAVPKYRGVKEKGYFATMKSDLRNLATAEESYFQGANTYYDGPIPDPAIGFGPSTGVTISLSGVSQSGWAAVATHIAVPGKQCALYHGNAPAVPPATAAGQAACQ
jgi:prepilin-type N-terminal cleavage/methylation domain-containing protein